MTKPGSYEVPPPYQSPSSNYSSPPSAPDPYWESQTFGSHLPVASISPSPVTAFAVAIPTSDTLAPPSVGQPKATGGVKDSTINKDGPPMVLVEKGSRHALKFRHSQDLRMGRPVPLELAGVHEGQGVGKLYSQQKKWQEWRYTETALGTAAPVSIKNVDGHLILSDTVGTKRELCLAASFATFKPGNPVNFNGGTYRRPEWKWLINHDGTISSLKAPHLVLGAGVEIPAQDLEGCRFCCCFPGGSAVYSIKARNKDEYDETGLACASFLLFLPIPYCTRRRRTRKGRNQFASVNDKKDTAGFVSKSHEALKHQRAKSNLSNTRHFPNTTQFSDTVVDFGPYCGVGGKCC